MYLLLHHTRRQTATGGSMIEQSVQIVPIGTILSKVSHQLLT